MNKIAFESWKNSMSFMIDDKFDNNFLHSIKPLTNFINQSCVDFNNAEKLTSFLVQDSPNFTALLKLKAFISVIGLSEERLKRVVSLMRFKFFQHEFKSEWTVKQISKKLQKNAPFQELLIQFFLKGRNSLVGQEIPIYFMRNFKLDDIDFIKDLSDFSYVERILNDNEIQGKYSNRVGAHVEQIIQNTLDNYRRTINNQLQYQVQKEFPLLNKNIDFLIPTVDAPIILIESSYNVTTGSGQSKRADQLVEFYSILMKHNANHRKNKIIMLNYCDGFGWVGRQNDLHRIYDASDFVFNQSNLNILDEVLNEYYQ